MAIPVPPPSTLFSHSTIAWAFLLVGGIGNAIAFAMRPSKYPAQNLPTGATAARHYLAQKPAGDGVILEPGWYPDPDDGMWLAYWDGEDWVKMDERFPNR